jgi:hypothetical protein
MPSDRSEQQIEQELAAEREKLGSAVHDLRAEVDELKRKLPFYAAGALAVAILLGIGKRLLFR